MSSLSEKQHSWMLVPIYVSGENALRRKQMIVKELNQNGIETRPVLTGNFLSQPAIKRITRYAIDSSSFKIAQEITENAFLVGAHHDLSIEQIDYLCDKLKLVSLRK